MRSPLAGRRDGDNPLMPIYVLIGAIFLVLGGFFIFNNFFLLEEKYEEDMGRELDEDRVELGQPFAVLDVNGFGIIKIELNEDKAPQTVKNFVKLINEGFYDGLTFHRAITDFMVQGGDPTGDGTGGPGYTIPAETDNGLTHDRGAIAMAKRGEDVRMSGSQFYIVHARDGTHHLDGQHTVFGMVVEGMDVIDAMAETPTDSNDRPLNPVIIQKATVIYD